MSTNGAISRNAVSCSDITDTWLWGINVGGMRRMEASKLPLRHHPLLHCLGGGSACDDAPEIDELAAHCLPHLPHHLRGDGIAVLDSGIPVLPIAGHIHIPRSRHQCPPPHSKPSLVQVRRACRIGVAATWLRSVSPTPTEPSPTPHTIGSAGQTGLKQVQPCPAGLLPIACAASVRR